MFLFVLVFISCVEFLSGQNSFIPCQDGLGLRYGVRSNGLTFELTSTSGAADNVKLNSPKQWIPQGIDHEYVQIQMDYPVLLTGILLQGDPRTRSRINVFVLSLSMDCENFTNQNYSLPNGAIDSTRTVLLSEMKFVTCLRFYPTAFLGVLPAARLELLGCVLGVANQCDSRIHPKSEEFLGTSKIESPLFPSLDGILDSGGRQLTYSRPVLIVSIQALLQEIHGWVVQDELSVFHSKFCDTWKHVDISVTDILSVSSKDGKQRWLTIELDPPIRAKCVRVFPPMGAALMELLLNPCNSVMPASLSSNDFFKYEEDIDSYQADAPMSEAQNTQIKNLKKSKTNMKNDDLNIQNEVKQNFVETDSKSNFSTKENNDILKLNNSMKEFDLVEDSQIISNTSTQLNESGIFNETNIASDLVNVANSKNLTSISFEETNNSTDSNSNYESTTTRFKNYNLTLETAEKACGTKSTPTKPYHRQKRVVGGWRNLVGEWPWLVSLHYYPEFKFTKRSGYKHACGGTLIDPSWVVSAAHCFSNFVIDGLEDLSEWQVYLGIHDLQKDNSSQVQTREITKSIRHPQYITTRWDYDITLLKLDQPVDVTDWVSPICFDNITVELDDLDCYVSGWGQVTNNSPGSRFPHTARLDLISRQDCQTYYDNLPSEHPFNSFFTNFTVKDATVCALVGEKGQDACQGDSGGPLMCRVRADSSESKVYGDSWFLVGTVASGYECGQIGFPNIYTSVSELTSWILSIIEQN